MDAKRTEKTQDKRRIEVADLPAGAPTLSEEEAEAVQGGRKAGGDQQEYLVVEMKDIQVSS